jgi:hypothetical protein
MRLYRPTGLAELRLVRDSGWTKWPPRLPDQPIFYPVTTFDYAEKIARDWNAIGRGEGRYGFVTEFDVNDVIAARYPVQVAGGRAHSELWVPADELPGFNAGIVGRIRIVAAYRDRLKMALDEALRDAGL